MNDIKAAILRLLLDKGPVYNWMKLDRALSQQGFFGNVAALVAELEHEGYIEFVPTEIPTMPVYKITEKGCAALSSS